MIFYLLAAQIGAAQEDIVVYEGAETDHTVNLHEGSEYVWEVFENFNPDIEADPTDYYFFSEPNSNAIHVHWAQFGLYYLKVTETDVSGCSNIKAKAITVLPNERTIGFKSLTSSLCFNLAGNSFEQAIEVKRDNGLALDSVFYPLLVEFTVNNENHSQVLEFNSQLLHIQENWFDSNSDQNVNVFIQIKNAFDLKSIAIQPEKNSDEHNSLILAHPAIEFYTTSQQIYKGSNIDHIIQQISGETTNAEYAWNVVPSIGTSSNLDTVVNNTATILWDGPLGFYSLKVFLRDGNNCISDTIIQKIEIIDVGDIIISAGSDSTIGNCNSFMLHTLVEKEPDLTYSYRWKPGEFLDDPTSATPIFTMGNTTIFELTVTNSLGVTSVDSVEITVSEITANAGSDVLKYPNSTAILDGTGSSGKNLQYLWTTLSGEINSGENTANPIVSGFGVYYLKVTDIFGCVAVDSVQVDRLFNAPIAFDDYDTTAYKTEVKIAVLYNDTDPDNIIDSLSLTVLLPPYNGTAYVDFDDFTIHYIPNDGFSGNDQFKYQICDFTDNCERANIFVLVTEYEFLIPDAFSPNNDNINDYFEIIGIDKYEGNSIMIFNRWGNKVYTATNYGISSTPQFWDGKSNTGFLLGDEELPTGTYYYVLNLGNGVDPVAGSIYLDR